MIKIQNYSLFKLLAIGGVAWFLVLVFIDLTPEIIEPNNANLDKIVLYEDFEEIQDETNLNILPPPNIFGEEDLGELGVAVTMPTKLPPDIQKIYDEGWKNNSFNQYLSDFISVHRSLPDFRSDYCREISKEYSKNLPKTSVIIIFHNEAWSTLLRSVHSVLDRSPPDLIEEVILVDDFSDMYHLQEPLSDCIADLPKVILLRAEKREGLIRARMRGARIAKAPTLTFLDSHIECTEGWLEPLLDRIAQNETNVVCPIIDAIDGNTLEFNGWKEGTTLSVGGFSWKLRFGWDQVPEREILRRKHLSEPLRSPTMAGGLFSIDRNFFEKLGMYDPGFDIWGSENLELSFKTWMCGGTLEIVPCSQVGHIFRNVTPYIWRQGVDVAKKNSFRLAEVWMDDYAKYYYQRTGRVPTDFGDISERVKLKNDLKCKSFKWYLDNIYPELYNPEFALSQGNIKSLFNKSSLCVSLSENHEPAELRRCSSHRNDQFFWITADGEIRQDSMCLDNPSKKHNVMAYECHKMKGNQLWTFLKESYQIYHNITARCLSINTTSQKLIVEKCNSNESRQKWVVTTRELSV